MTDRTSARSAASEGCPGSALRVLILMGTIGVRLTESMARRTGTTDITGNADVLILCELALRGPLRPRDLLAFVGLKSSGLTRHLDHLEEHGLVKRAYGRVASDRRAITVSLTDAGRRAARAMEFAVQENCAELRLTVDEIRAILDD